MSRHWKPEPRKGWAAIDGTVREKRRTWPAGATAGLLVVAATCVGFAVVLYKIAGPRDVFGG